MLGVTMCSSNIRISPELFCHHFNECPGEWKGLKCKPHPTKAYPVLLLHSSADNKGRLIHSEEFGADPQTLIVPKALSEGASPYHTLCSHIKASI